MQDEYKQVHVGDTTFAYDESAGVQCNGPRIFGKARRLTKAPNCG